MMVKFLHMCIRDSVSDSQRENSFWMTQQWYEEFDNNVNIHLSHAAFTLYLNE